MKLWKLRRELSRIYVQVQGWISEPFEPFSRIRHDKWLSSIQPDFQSIDQSKRIAVFLIYQPNGISESTLESCMLLKQSDFSILLVSNAPVSQHDRERLSSLVWCILERPNFGYDFGGYRDAIHLLWSLKVDIEHLLLVNDSIWFPVQLDCNNVWLEQLIEHPAAYCGAMELAGHRNEHRLRRQKPAFLGSFFLLFKRPALVSDAFKSFWLNYQMTSNKRKTIRRGERAISAAMLQGGFSMHALFRREMFDEHISHACAWDLQDILIDLIAYDDSLRIRQDRLLNTYQDSPEWITEARQTIFEITNLQNLFVTAPVACLEIFSFPILKKAQTYQNLMALQAIHRAAEKNRILLRPVIAAEISKKLAREQS